MEREEKGRGKKERKKKTEEPPMVKSQFLQVHYKDLGMTM